MRHRTATSTAIIIALVTTGGCAPLPDLSGYTAATSTVRQSVASAGTAVSSEADRAREVMIGPANVETLRKAKAEFDASWAKNRRAMDAMVRYAASIEAIATAGNEGAKSAAEVADQLQGLIGALGVPIAPAVGVAVSTGEKLFAQLALVRAAKSLKASLASADPAVRELQGVLSDNIADAERAYNQLAMAELGTIGFAAPGGFGDVIAADQSLSATAADRAAALDKALADGSAARAAALRGELATIAEARAAIAPQLADYQAKRAAIEARRRAARSLFGASRDALTAWTESHAELVIAINTRRPVTLASLEAAVADIRELIKQWRAL